MTDWIAAALAELDRQNLRRSLRTLGSPQGPEILLAGRRVANFCSNDYLGLASHPRVIEAARAAVGRWGAGAGASRLIAGNLALFEELEAALARFKGCPAALTFGSGYQANVGIIPALAGRGDIIFSDRLNHASLIDGCRLSRAEVQVFAHCDLGDLEQGLRQAQKYRRRLIVVESLFSMDGDLFPLDGLLVLAARYDALTYVDEAHATGVLGPTGRGAFEALGPGQRPDLLMGTLGKALGAFGAFACGRPELMDYLVNSARAFIFATGLPPAAAAAALEALKMVEDSPEILAALRRNLDLFRRGLAAQGRPLPPVESPIFPIIVGAADQALALSARLLEAGLFVQAIRPPTVPEGTSRLRVTLRADHREDQIQALLSALA